MIRIEPLSIAIPADRLLIPLYLSSVPAGFPSPADDYMDRELDLLELLVKHPAATFFCRVTGDSMLGAGIHDGDILIVDRAVKPVHGDVVVAAVAGELTCKYLDLHHRRLMPANETYTPIEIAEGSDLIIEGVVVNSIRCHRG